MFSKRFPRVAGSLMVTVLSTGWLMASPKGAQAGGPSVQIDTATPTQQVSTLLARFQSKAASASQAASSLQSISRGPEFNWESQANYLMQVREQVNSMNRVVERLVSLRPDALPWQQQAIDRTIPILADLARSTQSAIDFLNGNQERLFAPDYRAQLSSISERSSQLSNVLGTFSQLDRANQKLIELQAEVQPLQR